MFVNKNSFLKKLNNVLLEHSITDLKSVSDPARQNRAKSIITYYQGIEEGPDGQARTIWIVPSESNRDLEYKVTLAILIPNSSLFIISKSKWDPSKFASILKNSDVKIHCTCADFLYGGIKYNLGVGKYKGALEPKKAGYPGETILVEPPDITDPNRQHILCKHCIAIANRIGSNSFNIMKSAREYIVETSPSTSKSNKTEVKLKKDINLIDVDSDTKQKITEGIVRGSTLEEPNLEKDNLEPTEEVEIVDHVIDQENVPDDKEIISTKEKKELDLSEIPNEEPQEEKKEEIVDSNFNSYEKKVILSKDEESLPEEELNDDVVDDVLEREDPTTKKLEKDGV